MRKTSRRRPGPRMALAGVALLAGAGAVAAGVSVPSPARPAWPGSSAGVGVDPLEVAGWLRERRPGLRIVDLRTPEAFDLLHLPRAIRLDPDSLEAIPRGDGPLVVYAPTDREARIAAGRLRLAGHGPVHTLRGGILGWAREVYWPTLPPDPTPGEEARFRVAAELSRYFGGTPRRGGAGAEDGGDGAPPVEALVGEARRVGCGW